MKRTPPSFYYRQSGVIPYRFNGNGNVKILLVTSGSGKRWIIPKGVIDRGTTARASACKEAYEEAGIRGRTRKKPLGKYEYQKWGGTCTVQVFALAVSTQLKIWPEKSFRRRRWMRVKAAAKAVKEPKLKEFILSIRKRSS